MDRKAFDGMKRLFYRRFIIENILGEIEKLRPYFHGEEYKNKLNKIYKDIESLKKYSQLDDE